MGKGLLTLFALALLSSPACIRRTPTSLLPLQVSLYSGVEEVVRLGDLESDIQARSKEVSERVDLSSNADAQEAQFSHLLHFKAIGIRAYFRHSRVALIEIQEPFRGEVRGKRLKIFPFAAQQGRSWDEVIMRELGEPTMRVSGGRLSSEALFYSWGDISFNGMGPNEIALYRQAEVGTFRQKNFGRVIKLFGN